MVLGSMTRWRPLHRQRHPLPLRRRGGAPFDGRERGDPAPPGDGASAAAQRSDAAPAPADRGDRPLLPHAGMGLFAGRLGPCLLLARLHEFATETVEQLLDFRFRRAEHELIAVGEAIDAPARWTRLPCPGRGAVARAPPRSAAVFREEEGGDFRRSASAGWDAHHLAVLPQGHPLLVRRFSSAPYRVIAPPSEAAGRPKTSRGRCSLRRSRTRGAASRSFSMAGTSRHRLDHAERGLLRRLAKSAEIAYAQVEDYTPRTRIAALERELERHRSAREGKRLRPFRLPLGGLA